MIPAGNTNLSGSAWNGNIQQDVVFVGDDNRLYDLNYYRNMPPHIYPWGLYDIIALGKRYNQGTIPFPISASAAPRGGSPLVVFTSPAFTLGSTHYDSQGNVLFYISEEEAVQTVTLTGEIHQNLTQVTSTENYPPTAGSSLAGWAWQGQGSQHVVYVDTRNHVRELYITPGSNWNTNDLSARVGYTDVDSPRRNSPLAGNAFEIQGTQHVFYIARDNTIRELYYTLEQGWRGDNLSLRTGAPPVAADTPLVAYVCEFESTQHVIYIADNGDVQELWWSGRTGWMAGQPDLTQTTGAPLPAANSALAGYSSEYERSEHVIYVGNDGDLHELYHNSGGWQTTDLSLSPGSGATPPRDGTPLAGYSWESDHTHHVFYIDVNDNVHELYRLGNAWGTGVLSGSLTVQM